MIACGVLAADLHASARRLGLDLSFQFLPGGLHESPRDLRRRLQEAIDEASAAQRGERIAIGYGVCGLGTVGLAARQIPLAIPRVHDCIALFLGSDAAYRAQFAQYPGTYYVSAGWIDEKTLPSTMDDREKPTCGPQCLSVDTLADKYGAENAEAIRRFLSSWQRNYQRAVYIHTDAGEGRRRYAELAEAMAREFGWKYEEIAGSGALLDALLLAERTSAEVLVVPPHHITLYDAVARKLSAVPVWGAGRGEGSDRFVLVFDGDGPQCNMPVSPIRLGLGIDAGGTYTDVVLYDFCAGRVVGKSKALTTRWDYTIGINEALTGLESVLLSQVGIVSLSTTLATNAIVEGHGDPVGLLIMPPYGLFAPGDIAHRPLEVIRGQLEIDGNELEPVDPDQVRVVARRLVAQQGVRAFAVAGYASHNNPAHEIAVRDILRQETGLGVTCGHEVSDLENYRVRAQTAALNARIVPCLSTLISRVRQSLQARGISAPVMVVRSDGSLCSVDLALKKPIETILSGPAASVAGARHLASVDDAIVADIGGTTTDIARIRQGLVRTCQRGARVGDWRTHVRALDLQTTGLGGDSHVVLERGVLRVGPRRVAPVAWLLARDARAWVTLDWLERQIDDFDVSTVRMDLVAIIDGAGEGGENDEERDLLRLLRERPHSVQELAQRAHGDRWRRLPLETLERRHHVMRAALTPTDALHVLGEMTLWDAAAARRLLQLVAVLAGTSADGLAARVRERVVEQLVTELLKKEMEDEVDPDMFEQSPLARSLVDSVVGRTPRDYRLRVQFSRPVIGIGAPAAAFVPQAAASLETQAIIPEHADVANAIGAITSSVFLRKQLRIVPDDEGRYDVLGVANVPAFTEFEQAHRFAVEALLKEMRENALAAGTRETRVEIVVSDRSVALADGGQLFLDRTLEARLSGRPDVAVAAAPSDGGQ